MGTGHEAFVYIWTDKITQKMYIGYHKGSENDGYISSSRYFNHEYNQRTEDFVRRVIEYGSVEEMIALETRLLTIYNVKDNNMFYNMHNGDAKFHCGSEVNHLREETCFKNHGVLWPMQSYEIREKRKQTVNERFGMDCNLNTTDGIHKKQKTWRANLGVDWPMMSPEVRSKRAETYNKKYGCHPSQLENVKQLKREKNIAKYGVDNIFKSLEFIEVNKRKKQEKINRIRNMSIQEFEMFMSTLSPLKVDGSVNKVYTRYLNIRGISKKEWFNKENINA